MRQCPQKKVKNISSTRLPPSASLFTNPSSILPPDLVFKHISYCAPSLIKNLGVLQNILKTPGHGVKAFCSWELVRFIARHSPLLTSKAEPQQVTTGCFERTVSFVHTFVCLIIPASLLRVPFLLLPNHEPLLSFKAQMECYLFLYVHP